MVALAASHGVHAEQAQRAAGKDALTVVRLQQQAVLPKLLPLLLAEDCWAAEVVDGHKVQRDRLAQRHHQRPCQLKVTRVNVALGGVSSISPKPVLGRHTTPR